MSDETTDARDDTLQHTPVEDYSGDDTTDANGAVMQPSDTAYSIADLQAAAADTTATAPTPASSRDG